jgi:ATP synthase protein I
MFMSRICLSFLVAPLGGYIMGALVDAYWPGEISWAITLLFVGMFLGCINFWWWIRQSGM